LVFERESVCIVHVDFDLTQGLQDGKRKKEVRWFLKESQCVLFTRISVSLKVCNMGKNKRFYDGKKTHPSVYDIIPLE
jgi:hypothetical protein